MNYYRYMGCFYPSVLRFIPISLFSVITSHYIAPLVNLCTYQHSHACPANACWKYCKICFKVLLETTYGFTLPNMHGKVIPQPWTAHRKAMITETPSATRHHRTNTTTGSACSIHCNTHYNRPTVYWVHIIITLSHWPFVERHTNHTHNTLGLTHFSLAA